MKNEIDFLAIGDVAVDSFIELKEASVHCDIDDSNCTICMNWGDKIPFNKSTDVYAVGNSSNAAVSASRLGLKSGLFATIGKDTKGDKCIDALKKENVSTQFTNQEENKNTNHHYVLSFNAERTILIKHSEFNYKELEIPQNIKTVYFSSIGEHAENYHNLLAEKLNDMPDTKLVFQPGTYQIKLGYEKQKTIYQRTDIFVCNKEEAQSILKTKEDDVLVLIEKMHKLGPKIVCITDGKDGAYASDGNRIVFVPIYPDIAPPFERTGAGDAFTSTFSVFITKGLSIDDALLRAPINSMSVVQKLGAQEGLLTEEKLEKYLKEADSNYKLKVL